MDPSDLNFGQLLFLLKNEVLKNQINKLVINIKDGIHFSEICIREGLQPDFFNIYIIYIN